MNAHDSLLDNFSSMHEEFSSSNNRMIRSMNSIFDNEFSDLENSLDYFNGEYLVIDKRDLVVLLADLKKKLLEDKIAHVTKYQKSFAKEVDLLKMTMCNFFEKKLAKGDNAKKKMSSEIKEAFDKMSDLNLLGFEEELNDIIYNFKVDFECSYIRDEYCKDDFNKIIRTFEHSLFERLSSLNASALIDKQDIERRYAIKAFDIIEGYRNKKR